MKNLALVEPIPPVAIAGVGATTPENLLTFNPKEIAIIPGAAPAVNLDIDLGGLVDIDTFFLGYLTPLFPWQYAQNNTGPTVAVYTGVNAQGETLRVANNIVFFQTPTGVANPIERHYFAQLAAPVTARYVRFNVNAQTSGGANGLHLNVGALAIGKAFTMTWGHEWGAGRPVEDTSEVERLFGGSFGINEGVTASGWQWNFGDLTDAETRELYALVRRRGISKTLLVVEDPEVTVGLNERCHWGLFDRLEPYERIAVGATRYGFRIRDWA